MTEATLGFRIDSSPASAAAAKHAAFERSVITEGMSFQVQQVF
jgi:hypothetical protein